MRLDIYVEDSKSAVYNIEMQVAAKRNLPKRSRYYQGMIDLNSIFGYLKEELTQRDFTKKLYEEVEKSRENKE